MIRPHSKARPRKITGKGRKRGTTRILTDSPEKLTIENKIRTRQEKKKGRKKKANAKIAKRKLKDLEESVQHFMIKCCRHHRNLIV